MNEPAPKNDPRNAWVYFIRPTRDDFLADGPTDDETAILTEHFAYLQALTHAGTVILAGPCTDECGIGTVILQAPDAEAARRLMNDDPGVAQGVFNAELHPMRLSLLREWDQSAR